jgi:hypothetical protein
VCSTFLLPVKDVIHEHFRRKANEIKEQLKE